MNDGPITAANAPRPVGAYPHARRHGGLVFLSGLGPRPADGGPVAGVVLDADGEVTGYDFEAQCHAVFANLRTVLDSAGCEWQDLVDLTVFLTDIRRDFKTFNRLYTEYFGAGGPARTTVEINRLPTPIAIELKGIAAARD